MQTRLLVALVKYFFLVNHFKFVYLLFIRAVVLVRCLLFLLRHPRLDRMIDLAVF